MRPEIGPGIHRVIAACRSQKEKHNEKGESNGGCGGVFPAADLPTAAICKGNTALQKIGQDREIPEIPEQ